MNGGIIPLGDQSGCSSRECIVEIGDQQAHLIASYLSDALADLLDAMTALVQGADEATVSITEEPGKYRWRFRRVPQDRLCVRILWFDGNWSDGNGFADCPSVRELRGEGFPPQSHIATHGHRLDGESKVILEAECRLRTFAGAVLSASQRVLATHGLEGYREKWVDYEFPSKLQAKLQESLS